MKKIFPLCLFLLGSLFAIAQKDLTGAYGYSLTPVKSTTVKDKNAVPGGQLVLIRMEANKYRFWLDVLDQALPVIIAETDGTISFVNDTASFDNTFEDAEHPCVLHFKISGNTISINSHSTSFNCGFGNQGKCRWRFCPVKDTTGSR